MRTCPLNTSLFLSRLRLIWMVGEALDVGGGDSDRPASYQEQMSQLGQKRRFGPLAITSGLPRLTDIFRATCHKETHALQRTGLLFDHLVGAGEQRPQLAKREF